jgi:hypothetical protein
MMTMVLRFLASGLVALIVGSCSRFPKIGGSDPIDKLDKQAIKLADEAFVQKYTFYDDSWYAHWPLVKRDTPEIIGWKGFKQMKGVKHKIEKHELKAPDRLNGFEWRGRVFYSSDADRYFPRDDRPVWDDWQNGLEGFDAWDLERKEGSWSIKHAWVDTMTIAAPTLQEIKSLK